MPVGNKAAVVLQIRLNIGFYFLIDILVQLNYKVFMGIISVADEIIRADNNVTQRAAVKRTVGYAFYACGNIHLRKRRRVCKAALRNCRKVFRKADIS